MKDEDKELGQADLIEMEFLEKVMKRLPRDVEVLEALGDSVYPLRTVRGRLGGGSDAYPTGARRSDDLV